MKSMLRPLFTLFATLTFLTGLVYPLVVTAIGQFAFSNQVSGSLLSQEGRVIGSALLGQSFQGDGYFWGRLSASTPANNAAASSGSNFASTNPALRDAANARIAALRVVDPQNTLPIPVDLVTASASGLDPHISPAAALYQVIRIARVRHLDASRVRQLVLSHVEGPQWGLFGEPRVNVLMLNLALDRATGGS